MTADWQTTDNKRTIAFSIYFGRFIIWKGRFIVKYVPVQNMEGIHTTIDKYKQEQTVNAEIPWAARIRIRARGWDCKTIVYIRWQNLFLNVTKFY